MKLFEILKKEYDLAVNPIDGFDLTDLMHYFDEEEDRYKHTRGVAAHMKVLVEQLGLPAEEQYELMQVAYLHDIGYSKRVKSRGHHALDGAIFALEKALGEDVALAIMFHTAAYGESRYLSKDIKKVYDEAKHIIATKPKVKKYVDLITYCDLHTEVDGTPTTVTRRIFKLLARHDKSSAIYKNIKKHKRYFKRLAKRIRMSVVKEKTFLERLLDAIRAKQ
jgi:hypothetical protein